MHEYSIVQALLERVDVEARRHEASAVTSIALAVGGGAGIEPQLLRAAFELARAGTLAERAELTMRLVPESWRCRSCGAPVPAGGLLACPACGGAVELAAGDELLLERMELEVT